MPANIYPIFPKEPDVQVHGAVIGTSANTATDGTGANSYLLFTADSTNGGYVYKVILKPISTIAATVARVFLCTATGAFTAGTTNTAANSALITEVAITAWTASNTAASPQYEIPINMALPASFKLFITFGTSTGAGTTGFNPTTIGGKY